MTSIAVYNYFLKKVIFYGEVVMNLELENLIIIVHRNLSSNKWVLKKIYIDIRPDILHFISVTHSILVFQFREAIRKKEKINI